MMFEILRAELNDLNLNKDFVTKIEGIDQEVEHTGHNLLVVTDCEQAIIKAMEDTK